MNKLTDKQRKFCDEYLVDLNATQAAIRVGYSEKTASEQSSRLFTCLFSVSIIRGSDVKLCTNTPLKWSLK